MHRDQLGLPIPDGGQGRLPDRVPIMQPSAGAGPFDDPAYLFEPWWPGARAQTWVEGGRLTRIRAEGIADAMSAFGELAEELPGRLMEDDVILDGWLLALDDGGWLDQDLLRARLEGDRSAGRPGFVACDLLWSGGMPWGRRSFAARRRHLESVLLDGDRCVVSHSLLGEGTLLAEALARFGLRGLSARRLDARHRSGGAGDAWLRLPIAPAAHAERPRLALIQRLPFDDPREG